MITAITPVNEGFEAVGAHAVHFYQISATLRKN